MECVTPIVRRCLKKAANPGASNFLVLEAQNALGSVLQRGVRQPEQLIYAQLQECDAS